MTINNDCARAVLLRASSIGDWYNWEDGYPPSYSDFASGIDGYSDAEIKETSLALWENGYLYANIERKESVCEYGEPPSEPEIVGVWGLEPAGDRLLAPIESEDTWRVFHDKVDEFGIVTVSRTLDTMYYNNKFIAIQGRVYTRLTDEDFEQPKQCHKLSTDRWKFIRCDAAIFIAISVVAALLYSLLIR